MKNLYEFNVDFKRGGSIEGRFLATQNEIEAIIGKYVRFGEILGKHSDISGTIEKDEIRLITDNQEFLKEAEKLNVVLTHGYNPLEYYTCEDCGFVLNVLNDECENCKEDSEKDKGEK